MQNGQDFITHIVIVGGSYAGLSCLNTLIDRSAGIIQSDTRRGRPQGPHGTSNQDSRPGESAVESFSPQRALKVKPKYTLIDERDGFYHTLGAPLGQIALNPGKDFWVPYDEIVPAMNDRGENVQFIRGTVTNVGVGAKHLTVSLSNSPDQTQVLGYDFLVVASGIKRGWPVVPRSLDYSSYLTDIRQREEELSAHRSIVIVGGGACGIEMAAELKEHFPEMHVTLLHSRSQLLSNEPLPDNFKEKALDLLEEAGVRVRLNTRLEGQMEVSPNSKRCNGHKQRLSLSTDDYMTCDEVIFSSTQQGANTQFLCQKLLDEDSGCVLIRPTLQFDSNVTNAEYHYAVGDAAYIPSIIKRCGPAQAQGALAAGNIIESIQSMEDGQSVADLKLPASEWGVPSMTLAVGNQAVSRRNGLSFGRGVKIGAFGTALGIDGSLASLRLRPRQAAVAM